MRAAPLSQRLSLQWFAKRRGFLIGFLAQALQYGASLLLLPLTLHSLSAAELGVWYLLLTAQSFAIVADFGFNAAFARNIAAAMAGAEEIRTVGLAEVQEGAPNHELVARVIKVARLFYFAISLFMLIAMLTIGLWYITWLAQGRAVDLGYVQLSWVMMSFTIALSLYFSWVGPVLIGTGRAQQDFLSQIVTRGSYLVIGAAALLADGSLLGLALAQLAAVALGRWAASLALRPFLLGLPSGWQTWTEMKGLLGLIAPNATKFGLAGLSGFVITRSSVFAIATFVGLEASASFTISLQVISAIMAVAQLPLQFALPELVAANVRVNKAKTRRIAIKLTLAFVAIFAAGATALLMIGPLLLQLIGSSTPLLSKVDFALLALVFLLEGVHWTSAFVILSMNQVPFTVAALASACLVAAGSILAGWWGLGVTGIIACQGLVQLSYNNWKWPLVVFRMTRQ
jgi:O-antigen/teichoic acid export membrane protein